VWENQAPKGRPNLAQRFSAENSSDWCAMLNIKKILLPVDFPNTSLPVVHQAATLAHHFHSEIVMLHVATAESRAAGVPEGTSEGGSKLAR
jgi:hypothetical protein